MSSVSYALATRRYLSLETFADRAGLHPELVTRLVALGLLQPAVGPHGEHRFPVTQLATVARVRRLHDGLPLNYAAVGVVLDHEHDRVVEVGIFQRRRGDEQATLGRRHARVHVSIMAPRRTLRSVARPRC